MPVPRAESRLQELMPDKVESTRDETDDPGDEDEERESSAGLQQIVDKLRAGRLDLLNDMNQGFQDINESSQEKDLAERRHQEIMKRIAAVMDALHAQHGRAAVDRAKPYFDATLSLTKASHRVQAAVSEFSAAASQQQQAKHDLRRTEDQLEAWSANQMRLSCEQQESLSRATEHLLQCQESRDRKEQEYARALQAYNDAQKATDAWRNEVGDATIRAVQPGWKQIQQLEQQLMGEKQVIASQEKRNSAAKQRYKHAMRELEKISEAVHQARKDWHRQNGPEEQVQEVPPEEERPEDAYAEAERSLSARRSLSPSAALSDPANAALSARAQPGSARNSNDAASAGLDQRSSAGDDPFT